MSHNRTHKRTSFLSAPVRVGLAIMLLASMVVVVPPKIAEAAYIRIEGDPLDIESENDGQMGVWNEGQYQYYGTYAKGSMLYLNGTSLAFEFGPAPAFSGCGTTLFTPVSHTQPDPWTIETVFDAGSNIRITQTVEYDNGEKYYKITWRIANISAQTYTDNRFIHGGDTYFGGDDSAEGHWDSNLRMVYLTNPDPLVDGIMGLYGGPSSPVDHYHEDSFSTNWNAMCSGRLPDTVRANYHDAGYSVEWDRETLAPGEEWVIVGYEKWTAAGFVQVFAPPGQSGNPTDVFTYNFTVQNLQSFQDAFDLVAVSSEGWGVSLPGGNTVIVAAGASEQVTVLLSPGGACGVDTLTLTATSQIDPLVTNADSVQTDVACPLDFGDAPDGPYPTLLASNGARHTILAGFFLGSGVDAEADGQPTPAADGDDNDGNDDEDGVTFTSAMNPGTAATVDVVASAAGLLNAWIDFNGNGSWADAGEQIFADTPLVGGTNSLGFAVPPGATLGTTYARFRFSSATGLSYIGAADDGEVEDYQVSIEEAADHPPELSVSGTVTYTEDNPPLLIAPGLTLTDPEYDPLDGATVAIGDNFSASQDRLGVNGVENGSSGGVSWSYDTGTGILALTGTETITNYESILQQVTYLNNSQDPSTAARLVNFSIASGLYFPDNGHFYEFVTSPAIWWANALAGAAARDIYGMQGYLATITSAEENTFIAGKLQGQGWMGASDAGHDKQWYWETGPEAGTWFFTQNGYNPSGPNWCGTGGAVVPGHYANWLSGEPNDWWDGCAGREDYGHYYTNGLWNDYAYNNPAIEGYVVEYGGMPGDPVLSLTGVVTVNVVSVNDAPVAVDDSGVGFTTDEDTAFTTGNVLPNDSDVENDPLSIAGFDTTGTAGLVTNNGDGTFGYDPNGQFEWLAMGEVAYDTFEYTVSDSVLTDTAVVTITVNGVNDDPTAVDDTGAGYTTDEETAFTTASVLDNDTDPDTSDTLSVHSFDTTGTTGLVTNNGNGTFGYDPNGQFEYLAVGEQATDVFTYTVTDSNGGFDTAVVTITVNGVNDAPTANDDGYTTDEDTPFTTGSVLTNDTDPDTSDTLSVDSFDDSSTLGLVTNNGDGTFGYDPNGQFEYLAVGEQATDVFTYTVTDSNGGFDTAAVTITVNGVNDAPVANDDSGAGFITDEDTPFTTGSVLDNDSDAESDPLSVDSFDDSSTLGLVTGGSGGTFDYDPNAQFEWLAVGEVAYDTLQYTVSDGVLTDTATVTITVNGVNDAPTISDIPDQTTSSNTPVGPTGFTVGDVDTPAASLTLSAESSNTTLVPLSNITFGGSGASRTVTVTPTGTLVDETVTITVTVDDGMDTDSDTFTLTVEPLRIYLPLVMKNYVVAPDLVVEDIIATTNNVQLVIKNQGNGPTTEGFWVDAYINPSPIPTGVNQTWDMLGDEGLIWGVAVPLQPGEVITLTIGDQYYQPLLSHILWPLAVGTPIYAQVDSFNPATTYGTVRESHEMTGGPYNNITGDTVQAD